MRKNIFYAFLAWLLSLVAMAQLENGKVYSFENVQYSGKSMCLSTNSYIGINATNNSEYSQLWYVQSVGDAYTLRNLYSGQYLRSSNAQSVKWTMVNAVDDNCKFKCESAGSGYTLRASNTSNNYHYMHLAASQGNHLVGWEKGAAATQWKISEVNISEEDIENAWNAISAIFPNPDAVTAYQSALDALFEDKSCTKLRSAYASMSDEAIKADTYYSSLPTTLQNMVLKVKSGNWEEKNADENKQSWATDYAKKYRVQMYEPYNEPEAAAKALGINAHTNLNNPTGIYTSGRNAIYVMVEGEVEEGASLYLASYENHNQLDGYNEGKELHPGLNVIFNYSDNSNLCINYVVHTFDANKKGEDARLRKLSDYSALKIHIEGGHINGYWNKMGDDLYEADTDEDWNYIEARATQHDVIVLGEFMALQFPLLNSNAEGCTAMSEIFNEKAKISESIAEWDRMMMWQRFVMGLSQSADLSEHNIVSPYSSKNVFATAGQDYSNYYNVHGLAYSIGRDANPHGSWKYTGYPCGALVDYNCNILTSAGSHWTAAHEIGHQHQKPLNMNGLTEVTNNLFSNVTLWCFGKSTSRYNGTDAALSNVLAAFNQEGSDFFTNNIWAQTHLYYKLFLYYHVLGHNNKFYPALFEELRKDPMQISSTQDGAKCLLHFYKKCCFVAGEDLTEFFRAHGFFRVMQNRFVDDYTKAHYTMTQQQIDAAISEVKAKNYPENHSVLFINDAYIANQPILSHKGGNLELYAETKPCAEIGSYATFGANVAPEYTYSLQGIDVTMQGTGGVGFAIFNLKGEIICFSDKMTFTMSESCAKLLATGNATIVAVRADGTLVQVGNVLDSADDTEIRKQLGNLLTVAKKYYDLVDETGYTHPGYFKADMTSAFTTAYTSAKTVYDEQQPTSYVSAYENLNTALAEVLANKANRVPFIAGSTYVLTNERYSKSMNVNNNGTMNVSTTNQSATAQQWIFEAASAEDLYYIKNKSNDKYLGALLQSTQISANADKASAKEYKLYDLGDGLWAFQCQTDNNQMSLHADGGHQIVGWWHTGSGDDGSWWHVTATEVNQSNLAADELESLIAETEFLLSKVGNVAEQKLQLGEDNYFSNAKCKDKTYGDQFTSWSVLYDNNDSFFHSDYSGQAPNEVHHIGFDLKDKPISSFFLNYTTRNASGTNLNAPTSVVIEASNDNSVWTELLSVNTGLPATGNTQHTIEVEGNGTAYRFIRMKVLDTSSQRKANNQYFFCLKELGLSQRYVAFEKKYESVDEALVLAAYFAKIDAEAALDASADLDAAKIALQTAYNKLLAAKQAADEAALNSVTITIGESGYVTIYSDMPLTLPAGLTAYSVTNAANGYATLTEMNGIAANQGAILKGTANQQYTLTKGTVVSDWSVNMLKGTIGNTYIGEEAYILSAPDAQVGLYKVELDKNVVGGNGTTHFLNNAGKAYLPASVVSAGARFLGFEFDAETGIEDLETEGENAVIYDLSGRRVQKAQKGLYIVNGKLQVK